MPKSAESGENFFARNYKIAEPIAYPVFTVPGATGPSAALLRESSQPQQPGPYREPWYDTDKDIEFGQALRAAVPQETKEGALDAKKVPREVRAIWITHGMGQQVPFETVDSLARGVLSLPQPAGVTPRLRTVKIGDQILQRVELDIDGTEQDANGQPKGHYELHLYECYWAPKTEGVAKLSDTVSFLWDGALRGLLNSVHFFKRAMFGGMEPFRIPWRASIWISITVLVLLALIIIHGVIVAAAAARAKLAPLANLDIHWEQLAAIASSMIAVALSLGTVLFLAELSKPKKLHDALRLLISILSWIALIVTIASILATAGLMALTTRTAWTPNLLKSLPREQLQGFATLVILCGVPLVSVAMIWRAVLRSSAKPLRESRFLPILFALSFLLNLAAMAGPVWIWKFGKPLFSDLLPNAAFFFTIQGKDNLHIREQLAATVQPIIQSYRKFRKFKWINVFSRNDIISGPLEFYDLPGMQKLDPLPYVAVHNIVDKDASVPLVAHVDYWHNETVWKQLLSEIAP